MAARKRPEKTSLRIPLCLRSRQFCPRQNACAGARHFKGDQLIRARFTPRGLILSRGGQSPAPQAKAFGSVPFKIPSLNRHPGICAANIRGPGAAKLRPLRPGPPLSRG